VGDSITVTGLTPNGADYGETAAGPAGIFGMRGSGECVVEEDEE